MKSKGEEKKKKIIKKETNTQKNSNDINSFIITKIESFQNIIKKTILGIQKYKYLDVLGVNEINICIHALEKIYSDLNEIFIIVNSNYDTSLQNSFISKLQEINNDLSSILKNFGTFDFDDLITICFGSDFINSIINNTNKDKYEILKKYVHPIGYKVMVWKESKIKDVKDKDNKDIKIKKKTLSKNKIIEDHSIVEMAENFDCFDLCRTSQAFQTKVYGIKIAIQHEVLKKTLIICGVIDDIPK